VSVLDAVSGQLLRIVRVGVSPAGLALDGRASRLIVVNQGDPGRRGSATILAAAQGRLLHAIPVGIHPTAVAIDARRHRALVANFVSNTIALLDIRRGRLEKVIRLGSSPGTVARLAADGQIGRVFALSFAPRVAGQRGLGLGRIWIIKETAGRVVRALIVSNPTALAADTVRHRIIYAWQSARRGRVSAIDARSGVEIWTARVGQNPLTILTDRHTRRIFVVNANSGTVSVLDAQTGRTRCTVKVGEFPTAVAVDARIGRAFVANNKGNSVSVFPSAC
jgi:YVTN family beta-propeller protein